MTIECPYCDYEMDDPEECCEEATTYEHACESCCKQFVFTLAYSRDYYPRKAECLNGGEHNIVEGGPPRHPVMYCTMCGCERPLTEDGK